MKKLILFSLLAMFIFTSCEQPTIKKSDLPIEVVKLKETQKFDTILSIPTEKKVFLFKKDTEYIGTYKVTNDDSLLFYLGLGFGLIITLIVIIIVD